MVFGVRDGANVGLLGRQALFPRYQAPEEGLLGHLRDTSPKCTFRQSLEAAQHTIIRNMTTNLKFRQQALLLKPLAGFPQFISRCRGGWLASGRLASSGHANR